MCPSSSDCQSAIAMVSDFLGRIGKIATPHLQPVHWYSEMEWITKVMHALTVVITATTSYRNSVTDCPMTADVTRELQFFGMWVGKYWNI